MQHSAPSKVPKVEKLPEIDNNKLPEIKSALPKTRIVTVSTPRPFKKLMLALNAHIKSPKMKIIKYSLNNSTNAKRYIIPSIERKPKKSARKDK